MKKLTKRTRAKYLFVFIIQHKSTKTRSMIRFTGDILQDALDKMKIFQPWSTRDNCEIYDVYKYKNPN